MLAFKCFLFLPVPCKSKKPVIGIGFSRVNLRASQVEFAALKRGCNHTAMHWLIVLYGIMTTPETLITPVSDLFQLIFQFS